MPSFGEELKRERELRQISLREVSEATKISFRYLEALEANEFGELPGGVFNRGFVRAYSQYIGIDPESMVTSYLMEEQARQSDDVKQDAAIVMRRSGPATTGEANSLASVTSAQLRWGLAAIVTIVILAGGLLIWRWLSPDDGETATEPAPVETRLAAPARVAPTGPRRTPTGDFEAKPAEDDAKRTESTAKLAAPRPTSEPPPSPPEVELEDEGAPTSPAPPEATPSSSVASSVASSIPSPSPIQERTDRVRTRIRVVRATNGRVNCDNTRIEMLAGVRPGTTVEFLCKRFLEIDIADAGAIEVGFADESLAPLGANGRRLSAHRIDLTRRNDDGVPR